MPESNADERQEGKEKPQKVAIEKNFDPKKIAELRQ